MSENVSEKQTEYWQKKYYQSLAKLKEEKKHRLTLQSRLDKFISHTTLTIDSKPADGRQTPSVQPVKASPFNQQKKESKSKISKVKLDKHVNIEQVKVGMYVSQLLSSLPLPPDLKKRGFDLSIQCHLSSNKEMVSLLPCLQAFFIQALSNHKLDKTLDTSSLKIDEKNASHEKTTFNILLHKLSEQVPLPPSILNKIATLKSQSTKKNNDINDLIVRLVMIISDFNTYAHVEKKEYERLLAELHSRLIKFDHYISLNQNEGTQAREERVNLANAIESQLLMINPNEKLVAKAPLSKEFKRSFTQLTTLFHQYRTVGKRQYLNSQQRDHLLHQRIKLLEQENIELKQLASHARDQALLDNLTGIWNRHALNEAMDKQYLHWQRYKKPLSLIMWDIDFFKKVNDQYGHAAGDKILRIIANIFNSSTRNADFIARFGGEEFIGLFPETPIEYALGLANKIRLQVNQYPFDYNQHSFSMTTSAGLSSFKPGDKIEDVFRRADSALYKAKEQGRNCCVTQ